MVTVAGEAGAPAAPSTLVIACGALARELVAVIAAHRLDGISVTCLPAILHNRPEQIPAAVRAKIRAGRRRHDTILCLYGDCGTGGLLDKVLAEQGVERIEGPHCYAFFRGTAAFLAEAEREFDAFYLTDYLARHFERLVWQTFHLDRPGMREMMFGNYSKLVYLAQTQDPQLVVLAQSAADKLGLVYEYRWTGYGDLSAVMKAIPVTT